MNEMISEKKIMSDFLNIHEFNGYLNNMIDERFPGTERYIVNGGDYVKDFIIELRKDGKTLRYSPSELYEKSQDDEDIIEGFLEQWQTVLLQ